MFTISKKLIPLIAIVVCALVAGAAYIAYRTYQATQVTSVAVTEKVVASDLGLSFSFPSGEDAFSIIESPQASSGYLKAYLMVPTKAYAKFTDKTKTSEAPPVISVFVYPLDEVATTSETGERLERITRLQNWARDNDTLTLISLALNTPNVVEIDRVKALQYRASGLYEQEVYLASYKGRVYMFVTQFNKETDLTYTAFQDLIKTVSFD